MDNSENDVKQAQLLETRTGRHFRINLMKHCLGTLIPR